MDIEEVYEKLSSHMITGMMIHEQFANFYNFLNLEGYQRCHEYHYIEETWMHRKLNRYYLDHHNKLIRESKIDNPDIIPKMWFNHQRNEADTTIKIGAVKDGLTKWVNWETKTKKLYCEMYHILLDMGCVADSIFVSELIKDVDEELACATSELISKESINYDISEIVSEQPEMRQKYKKKMKRIF